MQIHFALLPTVLATVTATVLFLGTAPAAHADHVPAGGQAVFYNGSLSPGVVVTGSLTNADHYDWYSAIVTSGTTVSLTHVRNSGDYFPNLLIYQGVVANGQTVSQLGPLVAFTENATLPTVTLNYTPNFSGSATFGVSRWLGGTGTYSVSGTGFQSVSNPVPEPSEWLAMGMAGASVGGLMLRARSRRRRSGNSVAA